MVFPITLNASAQQKKKFFLDKSCRQFMYFVSVGDFLMSVLLFQVLYNKNLQHKEKSLGKTLPLQRLE